jgi:hypothetical protein
MDMRQQRHIEEHIEQLDNDYKVNQNKKEEEKQRSDQIHNETKSKIDRFNESIYENQQKPENQIEENRRVDWTPLNNGHNNNYCQGFMSSTNDQLFGMMSRSGYYGGYPM